MDGITFVLPNPVLTTSVFSVVPSMRIHLELKIPKKDLNKCYTVWWQARVVPPHFARKNGFERYFFYEN